jgi:hypothetical protein
MSLPWIITFGPLSDDEEWEPVVCGPYERPHALALAESVVADEELMAVVEPVQPFVSAEQIRHEIVVARLTAEKEAEAALAAGLEPAVPGQVPADLGHLLNGGQPHDRPRADNGDAYVEPTPAPSPAEVRAGFARIAGKLTA